MLLYGTMAERWMLFSLLVFIGSAAGGLCRHSLATATGRLFGEDFPLGTLAVNCTGSFAIGLAWPFLADGTSLLVEVTRVFLVYGFLGGYTTVSSFTWQTLQLLQEHRPRAAAANIVASYSACMAAVFAGFYLAR